ncbi:MAG: hypothetical protein GYB66_01680 [Chloroflexi bacterium]|nr:hypothetical protein [Chloroflexota bacterium]
MTSYNSEHDLRVLKAMVAHLTPYLYEDELFGQVDNRLPKLTLGGLLMRLYRLEQFAEHLSPAQRQDIQEARKHLEATQYEWLNHYKDKIQQELPSRINAINWYLDDCRQNPVGCDSGWPNEAEKRTIIAHLRDEAERLDILSRETKGMISDLDGRIRHFHKPGAFIWSDDLKPVYPRERFWWLYGRPGELEEE